MNTSIATIVDTFRQAKEKIESAKSSGESSELGKWIIVAAAVFGALMLMRSLRAVSRLLFGLFWVWFWTHGAWRHIF
jgi:hypothetical protein